ncbi:MAG: hypothetical protein R6V46_01465 [Desulfatiglandaceae bacterium]|mgnify:CR=1 FL=1|jgi:hypothetical protein
MTDFISISPLKILEKSCQKGLGRGNLGVVIARAGVGKTACLIHIALDKIFHHEKLVHISLDEGPEKVTSYYRVIYSDLLKNLHLKDDPERRLLIDRNRIILAYMNRSFETDRLRAGLGNLAEKMDFKADALVVDGLDFETVGRSVFEGFKEIAEEFEAEVWFSALSHRHMDEVNQRGIPHPCRGVDDLFGLILQLHPEPSGIHFRLLKDHDNPTITQNSVVLDPNTFLALVE